MYGQGDAIYDLTDPMNPKLIGREPAIMEGKYKQHLEMSKLPDEKVISNMFNHLGRTADQQQARLLAECPSVLRTNTDLY